jgi:hypothetical protein
MSLLVVTGVTSQELRGMLEGTVLDAHRAVMPGATVAATNLAQAVTVETVADASFRIRSRRGCQFDSASERTGVPLLMAIP